MIIILIYFILPFVSFTSKWNVELKGEFLQFFKPGLVSYQCGSFTRLNNVYLVLHAASGPGHPHPNLGQVSRQLLWSPARLDGAEVEHILYRTSSDALTRSCRVTTRFTVNGESCKDLRERWNRVNIHDIQHIQPV